MDANKETAAECTARARKFLAAGELDRAKKFASKAMNLYPSEEAKKLLDEINRDSTAGSARVATPPSAAGPAAAEPRQRATRSASAEPAEPTTPRRQPSETQANDVNRVLRLGENKLYEKLGVPRDADEAALKKAYKKLSLKLHPDRNPHPKAEAAFQAVNKAHEVLSDQRQRQVYDMTGEVNQQGGGGGGFGRGNMQQVDPDELIRMMFGGGFRAPGRGGFQRGGFHFHTTGFGPGFQQRNRRQAHDERQDERGGGNDGSGLLWMLIVFMSLNFLFSGNSQSTDVYKLDRQGVYTYPMHMESRKLPQHTIKYFVSMSAGKQLATAKGKSLQARQMSETLRTIERGVEEEYWAKLRNRCAMAAARGEKRPKKCDLIDRLEEAQWARTGPGRSHKRNDL